MTNERMNELNGTEGHEDFILIAKWNHMLDQSQYAEMSEQIAAEYKNWPKWFPREWKPTHRHVWTWKLSRDRYGCQTLDRVNFHEVTL